MIINPFSLVKGQKTLGAWLFTCCALIYSGCAFAVKDAFPYDEYRGYAAIGQITLADTVLNQGIDTTAHALRFGSEKQQKHWLLAGGVSAFLYHDNAKFAQQVNNTNGSGNSVSSTAGAVNLYVEGGYHYSFLSPVQFAFIAGYEHQLFSSRGILNCRNCYEEPIKVNTGFYLQPRLTYSPSKHWYIGAYVSQYIDVTVQQNMAFVIGRRY
ncbi:hypothetical protein [Saccharophagus degradans]|uniref:Outer membrane protein beta-barrel domain-containing protein n=1 Tax=Saccharophagus degradans TaxID=86304 RepID=A0AAW7X438_9GAMM|nr:hypothetical protein [Saccharophagus degradans]MDO6422403.1 hypothetical protein [Saccharophagus degradans]MDO6608057.1 hypothetical protein [Saccharophagus degradans]